MQCIEQGRARPLIRDEAEPSLFVVSACLWYCPHGHLDPLDVGCGMITLSRPRRFPWVSVFRFAFMALPAGGSCASAGGSALSGFPLRGLDLQNRFFIGAK